MSGLVAGAKKVPRKIFGREAASLDARVAGLGQAVEGGRGRLDDTVVAAAAAVVERAEARLRLSADHTVVALAGATGSGKSSTFNALCGLDLAAVGVRRPTTSWATACIWGADPADGLLEWLDIPERHRVLRDSRLDSGQQEKELDRPRAARPARPRLHRGEPPPRGRPADRDDRPDDLGARPAEVRRRGGPRPVPAADGHPQGRDAHRRQPHRRGARGPATEPARRRTPAPRGRRAGWGARARHLGHDGGGDRRAAHGDRQAGQRQGVGPHPTDR